MDELTPRIVDILKPYMITAVGTRRDRLGIDALDLPLIVFDIEDAFSIQMRLEDIEELTDVGEIAAHVRKLIEGRPTVRRPLVPVCTTDSSQSAWTLSGTSRRAPRLLQAA
jgi:acyl carrier protein